MGFFLLVQGVGMGGGDGGVTVTVPLFDSPMLSGGFMDLGW